MGNTQLCTVGLAGANSNATPTPLFTLLGPKQLLRKAASLSRVAANASLEVEQGDMAYFPAGDRFAKLSHQKKKQFPGLEIPSTGRVDSQQNSVDPKKMRSCYLVLAFAARPNGKERTEAGAGCFLIFVCPSGMRDKRKECGCEIGPLFLGNGERRILIPRLSNGCTGKGRAEAGGKCGSERASSAGSGWQRSRLVDG